MSDQNIFSEKLKLPYPEEIIKNNDIFEVILPDGGAYMFYADAFYERMTGESIVRNIESGEFYRPWTVDGTFRWDAPLVHSFGKRTAWERLVWLNRLYMLIPLAHAHATYGEDKYFDKWWDLFTSFIDFWTPRKSEPECNIIFSDMQVTWRFLSVMYSVCLFKDSDKLTNDKAETIYNFLVEHADRLLLESELVLKENGGINGGNHFQQKGLALIYASLMTSDKEKSIKYLNVAKNILSVHLDTEMYVDGGNSEGCPSYSHFIARMHLDAYLLMERNSIQVLPGTKEKILKTYEYLYKTLDPEFKTLQLNDSFRFDGIKDLELADKVFSLPFMKNTGAKRRSEYFRKTGFAVLRRGGYEVFVDCMNNDTFHCHFGGPQTIVYYGKKLLLKDGGCVNYDLDVKEDFLHRAPAHNVVFAKEFEENYQTRDELWELYVSGSKTVIEEFSETDLGLVLKIKFTLSGKEGKYDWYRTIELDENGLSFTDKVQADREMNFVSSFHFPNGYFAGNGQNYTFEWQGEKKEIKLVGEGTFALVTEQTASIENVPEETYRLQTQKVTNNFEMKVNIK